MLSQRIKKLAKFEITRLKKMARKHAIEKVDFNKMKALWEHEKNSKPQAVSRKAQYFTLTVPVIKGARYIRWNNNRLRTNISVMIRQIEHLNIQLSKPEGQPRLK